MKQVLAVSISKIQNHRYQEREVATGIYKSSVEGRVAVGLEGCIGDEQADRENHGGPDKAVYVYAAENYPFWQAELGCDALPPGQFGENLTVTGMPDHAVHVGDVFRFGTFLGQVTQPRVPCFKLGMRMGGAAFVKTFLTSGRVGFYLRVLEPGFVAAGDAVEAIAVADSGPNIQESMLAIQSGPRQQEIIEQLLQNPALSVSWRENLMEKRLGG